MRLRTVESVVAGLLATLLAGSGQELPRLPAKLNIVVVEGEGTIHHIKRRTTRETIVRVEDDDGRPVTGAAVAFLLPADGPGGSFVGGTKSVSVMTDGGGRATMPHIDINANPGSFAISVYASRSGAASGATITQSSAVGSAGVSTGGLIGIIAGVAAAGGVAMAVVTKGKSGASGSSTASGVATGAVGSGGGGTFGPPH